MRKGDIFVYDIGSFLDNSSIVYNFSSNNNKITLPGIE